MDDANPVTDHPVSRLHKNTRFLTTGDAHHTGPLGIISYMCGGVIWELVYDGMFQGDERQRLQTLCEQLMLEYEVQNSGDRVGMLTKGMLVNGANEFTCFLERLANACPCCMCSE